MFITVLLHHLQLKYLRVHPLLHFPIACDLWAFLFCLVQITWVMPSYVMPMVLKTGMVKEPVLVPVPDFDWFYTSFWDFIRPDWCPISS